MPVSEKQVIELMKAHLYTVHTLSSICCTQASLMDRIMHANGTVLAQSLRSTERDAPVVILIPDLEGIVKRRRNSWP